MKRQPQTFRQLGTTDHEADAARENDQASARSSAFTADSPDIPTYSRFYQGGHPQRSSTVSHAVLLANFDPTNQEALELTLRRCRYNVVRPEVEGISLDDLKDEDLVQVDFVVFNLTHRNAETWRRFERICNLRKADGMLLMVQGWSRVYHGAEFHHAVEKLGAMMVYA